MNENVTKYPDGFTRCRWPKTDPIYLDYHDREWGVPLRGDDALFENLSLEGFQAGLSWITILRRREAFRKAFRGFEISKVAKMTERDVARLMLNDGIIRNRAKIESVIKNARICQELETSLEELIWSHAPKVRTKRIGVNDFQWLAVTAESEALSKSLRSLGFSFVGPTTMYAMMQSIGMVNDHAPGCFRRNELARLD